MLVEKWETQQMVAWDVYHTLCAASRPETYSYLSWMEGGNRNKVLSMQMAGATFDYV